jgi:predicted O-methyltransferase YrrM
MQNILKRIIGKGQQIWENLRYYRFYALKKQTGGMLRPGVYHKIYELCRQLPEGHIIEVGGASGAGSIAIAWALRDTHKRSKLITVEKCEGGSRTEVGNYTDNLALIQQHFAAHGAADQILLYPHELTLDNGHEVLELLHNENLAAFIHDADGRLDRDFALFWPRLMPNGLMIVDDYANKHKYRPLNDRYQQGGAKKMITFRLLNQLIKWGLFVPSFQMGETIFGYKPPQADFSQFDFEACQHIIADVHREREEYIATHTLERR